MAITSFRGAHFFLSNFYESDIVTCDGEVWRCAEGLFQSRKVSAVERWRFVALDGPAAKAMGKSVHIDDVRAWDMRKLTEMSHVIRCKFDPDLYPEMTQRLLDTGSAQLIEGNAHHDTFWGVCKGRGANWLGVLLMQRRDELLRACAVSV